MSRYEIVLRVDAASARGHSLSDALTVRSEEVRAAVYRKLRLRVHSNAWVTIDLGSERGQERLRRLVEECRSEGALIGTATVSERWDAEENAAADWHILVTPMPDKSFSLWNDYPRYVPGDLPEGHACHHTFVSSGFVDAYRRLGLEGLSFLRCRNAGRKASPPWFAALPDDPLGHGLDHPWFDRDRWVRDVGSHPRRRSSSVHTAQNAFPLHWVRRDLVKRDPIIGPLLGLFPEPSSDPDTLTGLTIVTVPRYWARAFPDADFAYLPWGEDGPNREGKMMRFRRLAVGARARNALVTAGLFSEKDFLAVRSVGVPEPGVAILDERYAPVPPMYSREELAELRRREQELFPAH